MGRVKGKLLTRSRARDGERQRELIEAREQLRKAEAELSKIKEETSQLNANTFVRPGYVQYTSPAQNLLISLSSDGRGKSIVSRGKSVLLNLLSTTSDTGFAHGHEAEKKLGNLELWSGQKGNYLNVAGLCIKLLQKIVEDELYRGTNLLSTKLDAQMTRLNEKDPNLVIVESTLRIPPSVMLLIQLRAQLRGKVDDMLLYMEEKYAYTRSSRAFLHHTILTFPFMLMLTPRDFVSLVVWDEDDDGTIWLSSQSVKGLLHESAGCVRGLNKVMGMRIQPVDISDVGENVEGCRVTYVVSVDPKVWLPRFHFNDKMRLMMASYLEKCESLGQSLMDRNEHDAMIEKYLQIDAEVESSSDADIDSSSDDDEDDDDDDDDAEDDSDGVEDEAVRVGKKKRKAQIAIRKRPKGKSVRFKKGTKFLRNKVDKSKSKNKKSAKVSSKRSDDDLDLEIDSSSSDMELSSDDEKALLAKLAKKYDSSSESEITDSEEDLRLEGHSSDDSDGDSISVASSQDFSDYDDVDFDDDIESYDDCYSDFDGDDEYFTRDVPDLYEDYEPFDRRHRRRYTRAY
uniref:START domain-containing protein n=1 Tax=Aplanochytrium stocchinoi TaxID=215587 RepID=A0A6S8FKR2_9STRA|eukprot:CAMPEP_0204826354 /NCGR_PEP_ID=MMETSP1346-20131115/4059_1 /ASSEMBLY_ACC=CAM_ASM_000771 /TAXON_ID=215587 /ORGANISM="Aplanochytrium stocchinoi, Strain GSBS06" /LENGTH=568 /DNA_ID=CAMNT_0051954339 /DNA_START=115 /DNA_END=1821 /DNA_ORIENTATION=-